MKEGQIREEEEVRVTGGTHPPVYTKPILNETLSPQVTVRYIE